MVNSVVMPFPDNPKKCRMSLMVLQYGLPPASPGGGAAADADAADAAKVTPTVSQRLRCV